MEDVMHAPVGGNLQLVGQIANLLFDLVGPNPFRLQLGSRTRQGEIARRQQHLFALGEFQLAAPAISKLFLSQLSLA